MGEENYNPTRVTLLAKLKKAENDEAWLEFETIYRGFILSLILRMGINADDAEDISQAVLTKVDKISRAEREAVLDQVKGALGAHPAAYPEIVVTSSEKGEGIETLRALIATMA